MPEIAEVEFGRKLLEQTAVGRRIVAVRCADDPIVVQVPHRTLEETLQGATPVAAHRRGKQLWLELDSPPHLLIHFGMTGALRVPDIKPVSLESAIRDHESWPPRFTILELDFDDEGKLAFTNARRLGRLGLKDDPENEPPISKLGFDPLYERPSLTEVAKKLSRRKGPIKAVLLDQGFAAGVGNWVADEVLYQAKIAPHRPAHQLTQQEVEQLMEALHEVVRKAVDADADAARFPKQWLFHARWNKRKPGATIAGQPIQFDTVGGRTTAWVPDRQG